MTIDMTTTPTLSNRQEEANRRIAIDFLESAATGHAVDAMHRYAAPDLVHHNPYFASDATTLARGMDDNFRENPAKKLEILRTIAEGPLVVLHGRVTHKPADAPVALVHIFRIEDGRIRELWDFGQELVPDSPNSAGLF